MNQFFTSFYLYIGVFFFITSPLLQAQKCGKATVPATAVVAEAEPKPSKITPLYIPPKYQPLVSEQTQIPSKKNKMLKKRQQRYWKRQQRLKKKGCPAAKF